MNNKKKRAILKTKEQPETKKIKFSKEVLNKVAEQKKVAAAIQTNLNTNAYEYLGNVSDATITLHTGFGDHQIKLSATDDNFKKMLVTVKEQILRDMANATLKYDNMPVLDPAVVAQFNHQLRYKHLNEEDTVKLLQQLITDNDNKKKLEEQAKVEAEFHKNEIAATEEKLAALKEAAKNAGKVVAPAVVVAPVVTAPIVAPTITVPAVAAVGTPTSTVSLNEAIKEQTK